MKRVVVVGGGISGLAAAHRLLELGVDVQVLEAGGRAGGALRTERTEDGFVIERGPDSILTSKPAALELATRLGIEDRVVRTREENRGAYVVHRGRLVRIPKGFQVVAPGALGPLWRSPVLSTSAKLRSSLDLLLPRGRERSDESLASFVRRRFGDELLVRLAQPMAGGIYGAAPERLSLRATMPRFLELESEERSVTLGLQRQAARGAAESSGARYGLFISFDRGIGVLPETLAKHLGERLHTGQSVRALERQGTGWRVRSETGVFDAEGVLLALPARPAASLLEPHLPEVSAQLRGVRHGSAATVALAYEREQVPHPMDASGFVVPAIERRLALASTWFSSKWPGRAPEDKVLIRVFLGGNDRDEIVRYGNTALVRIARRALGDWMGIEAAPLLYRVDRYVGAMPRYELGHLLRMDRVDAAAESVPTLALSGSWYRGVGIPDSIANAQQAAERLALGM